MDGYRDRPILRLAADGRRREKRALSTPSDVLLGMDRPELAELLSRAVHEAVAARVSAHPPALLTREEAAAFVGVGVTVFDAEVEAGIWPRPIRRGAKGTKPTWSVPALNAALAKLDAANAPTVASAAAVPMAERPTFTAQQHDALVRLRARHG